MIVLPSELNLDEFSLGNCYFIRISCKRTSQTDVMNEKLNENGE